MKKIMIIALLVLSGSVFAQSNESMERPPKGERPTRGMQKQAMQDLSPSERATLEAKKMTLHLDLSDKQQKAVTEVLLDRYQKREAKGDVKNRRELSKEERLAIQNERLDEQIAFKRAMKNILNEDQMTTWEKSMQKRRGGLKKKMKQRRGNK